MELHKFHIIIITKKEIYNTKIIIKMEFFKCAGYNYVSVMRYNTLLARLVGSLFSRHYATLVSLCSPLKLSCADISECADISVEQTILIPDLRMRCVKVSNFSIALFTDPALLLRIMDSSSSVLPLLELDSFLSSLASFVASGTTTVISGPTVSDIFLVVLSIPLSPLWVETSDIFLAECLASPGVSLPLSALYPDTSDIFLCISIPSSKLVSDTLVLIISSSLKSSFRGLIEVFLIVSMKLVGAW